MTTKPENQQIQQGASAPSRGFKEHIKHTPGPWAIEYRTDGQFTYSPRIYAGPAVIHYTAGYHAEEQDATFKARAEANARLIAAAPELLEASGCRASPLLRGSWCMAPGGLPWCSWS